VAVDTMFKLQLPKQHFYLRVVITYTSDSDAPTLSS